MSGKTSSGRDPVQVLGRLVEAAGVTSMVSGVVAWFTVRAQLADEKIVVPGSGRAVTGPLSAYQEADVIKQIALRATEGKTYGELEEDHPAAAMAKDASLLRASLFTSILAFGMAGTQVAVGAVLTAIGRALSRTAKRLPALPA